MTAIDYAVFLILAASILLGVMRGFVREVLSLAAWVAAFWSANLLSPELSGMLPKAISGEPIRIMVAFVAIFLGVLILAALLTKILSGLVKHIGLGWVDGLLGFVFGLARGGVIVLVLVLLAGMTSIPQTETWKHAECRGMLETGGVIAGAWLPASVSSHIRYGSGKLNYK